MIQLLHFRNVKTVKCERCELSYSKKEAECPHCKDLSDSQVQALKHQAEREGDGHSSIGKTMFLAAGIFAVVTVVLFLLL